MKEPVPPPTDTWSDAPPGAVPPPDDTGTWADGASSPASPPLTQVHGPHEKYELTGEMLGRGGLGRVDAVRDRDLGREVARKALHVEGPAQRERFLREARVTAQLEHPGIVPVYELGQGPDGRLFYTMRRIRGRTFGAALASCGGLRDRLGLVPAFVAACQAVAYAHARGVIHRDLKPENLMVGEFGESLVVDWGLAKVTTDGNVETALTGAFPAVLPPGANLTRMGATMGTPAYMSPEQARGETETLDARTDVWSLGAILFEVLAGRALFHGIPGDTTVERLRRHEFGPLDDPLRGAPPDLVAIVRKALAPERAARYADAGDLAEDIVRWQTGGLVDAYRYSSREVVARLIRKNWPLVLVGGVALAAVGLAVAALAGGGLWSYRSILAERDRAVAAETLAATREDEARLRLARSLTEAAVAAQLRGDLLTAEVLALGSLEIVESPDARGVLVAATSDPQPTLFGARRLPGPCQVPTIAPDGRFACWGDAGISVWTRLDRPPTQIAVDAASNQDAWRLEFSPSGRRLVVVNFSGAAAWVDLDAPTPQAVPLDVGVVNAAAFLDEGRVIVASDQRTIGVVDLATAAIRWSSKQAVVRFDDLSVLDDGSVLVGSVNDPTQRWDTVRDAWSTLSPPRVTPMLAASHDGSVRVSGGGWGGSATPLYLDRADGSLTIDDADSRSSIGISGDGRRAFAASSRELVVWDGPSWQVRARIPTDAMVLGASMSRDGRTLLVTEADGDLRIWQLPPPHGPRPLDAGGTVWDVRASGDGALLVSGGNDGVLRVWDAASGDLVREMPLDAGGLGFMTTDGRDALVSTNTMGLQRVGLDDLSVRWVAPMVGVLNDVQQMPDGTLLIGTTTGEVARLSAVGEELWRVHVADWVAVAAPGPEGDVIVGAQGAVVRLSAADGHELHRTPLITMADTVIPTRDGRYYVGEVGKVTVYDRDGRLLQTLAGQYEGGSAALEVSEALVSTGDQQGRLCLWGADGAPKACWAAHGSTIWRSTFVPGKLASAGADGAVRLWDLAALEVPVAAQATSARSRYGLVAGDGVVVEVPAERLMNGAR